MKAILQTGDREEEIDIEKIADEIEFIAPINLDEILSEDAKIENPRSTRWCFATIRNGVPVYIRKFGAF